MPRRTVGQFGANACGRDLVVGDVHGCFRTLDSSSTVGNKNLL